jgi:hypothetical protein
MNKRPTSFNNENLQEQVEQFFAECIKEMLGD